MINTAILGDAPAMMVELQAGHDPNEQEEHGYTPLLLSANKGHLELAQLLLNSGADPNLSANEGLSPLIAAAMAGHVQVVQLLLETGANPNQADENGWTPIESGVAGASAQVVSALIRAGADVSIGSSSQTDALRQSIESGEVELVKLLLSSGADPNQIWSDGLTPMMVLNIRFHADSIREAIAEELVKAGFDPDAHYSTNRGWIRSVLHVLRLLLPRW